MQSGRRSLRITNLIPQLFVWIILPLTGLVLVIAFGSVALHDSAMRDISAAQDLRVVRAVAAIFSEQINHREDALQSLGNSVAAGLKPEAVLGNADYLLTMFDGGVAFYDHDGNLLGASDTYQLEPRYHPQVNALLASLPLVTEAPPLFSPDSIPPASPAGQSMVLLSARITSNLAVVGAFSTGPLVNQAVQNTYNSIDTNLYLVDSNLQVIYQNTSLVSNTSLQDHPGFREVQQGQYGIAYDQEQGGEQIVAYAPVTPTGWGVVIEEPWQVYASPYLRSTQNAPLVLVPVLLLTILALWFGARQIIRPLQELAGQAGSLAAGDYHSIQEPVEGIAEIRDLQLALIEMSARVQSAQANLRRYIAAITNAQEDERRRLARELHDDTLQSVIALNQRVQLARLSLNGHPAGKALSETQALTEQTVTNLRRLMRGLRPAYLEEVGLASALQMLAQEASESMGIPVDFQTEGDGLRLSPEIELILYRMVQEALNNVARHAHATQTSVRIAFEPDKLQLEVRDNGAGFVLPDTLDGFSKAGHFGLLGLYERAELSGARLQVESAPGRGTRIAIELATPLAGQGKDG